MTSEADPGLLYVYTNFEYTVLRKGAQSKPISSRFTMGLGDRLI